MIESLQYQVRLRTETQENLFRELEVQLSHDHSLDISRRLSLDQNSFMEGSIMVGLVENQVKELQDEIAVLTQQKQKLLDHFQEQEQLMDQIGRDVCERDKEQQIVIAENDEYYEEHCKLIDEYNYLLKLCEERGETIEANRNEIHDLTQRLLEQQQSKKRKWESEGCPPNQLQNERRFKRD